MFVYRYLHEAHHINRLTDFCSLSFLISFYNHTICYIYHISTQTLLITDYTYLSNICIFILKVYINVLNVFILIKFGKRNIWDIISVFSKQDILTVWNENKTLLLALVERRVYMKGLILIFDNPNVSFGFRWVLW